MELLAATVLTGFLGSGKSTLLRRILSEDHGHKIAVIENEFAEENIDSEIILSAGSEQIVKMTNGCVCCTIREDLRATLLELSGRRNCGDLEFDRVVIETTGLADPGPVAQTFFLDEQVASQYRPDAILTMVDAKHAMSQLDTRREARRQVGFADRIFLSKTDLVSQNDFDILCDRLTQINARAPQFRVSFGAVPLSAVFDVGGFNLDDYLEFSIAPAHSGGSCGEVTHSHYHDDVKSFVFRSDRPIHGRRFQQFMNAVVSSQGSKLLRYKGILNLQGRDRKVILQGVHQLMSHDLGDLWLDGEKRISKLVFIGIELPRDVILRSLEQCILL